MISKITPNVQAYDLKVSDIETLAIKSQCLKDNPLSDSSTRFNMVIKPKNYNVSNKYKLLVMLSGFTSNGTKYFAHKPFEKNFPQRFDEWCEAKNISNCIVICVDAFTFWGGSQFINSKLMGNYEDYIMTELIPTLKESYSISDNAEDICVTGGSSGGYGALHLGSKFPNVFGKVAALAPDCDFGVSLLPEVYHALPLIKKWGGISKIKDEIRAEKFFRRRQSHTVINVIAMACCYSSSVSDEPNFPVNLDSGELNKLEWQHWLQYDPLVFIKNRSDDVKKLYGVYLEVGKYDQFNLQYGSRKLNRLLVDMELNYSYKEFEGNHFDISQQRPNIWSWFLL